MAGEITKAVGRWKLGDDDAQFDLVRQLQPFLFELIDHVRDHLNGRLKPRIDEEAVVNAALKSFLSGVRKDQFPLLTNRENVKKLLHKLVRQTLTDDIRRESRQKRDAYRDERNETGVSADVPTAPDTATLAEDLTALRKKLEAVLRSVHPKAIDIMELAAKDMSNADIARQLGLGVRNVQVIRKKMKERWDEATGQES
jgi:RNA polymerase sigma factor (sigma-70 family)